AAAVESWREEKAEVESKLQSLRSTHASLQTEKEDFQLKVSSVQAEKESELQKLRSTHATFQAKTDSELTSHKTTIGRLQTKLKELEEEKQRAVQDKDTSTAEADRQLKDAKERAETTIVQLKSRVEDLETEAAAAVKSWHEEKAEVESKLHSKYDSLVAQKVKVTSSDTSVFCQRIFMEAEVESELHNLRSTHASLRTEKEELQSKDTLLQAAKAAKTKVDFRLRKLRSMHASLTAEKAGLDSEQTSNKSTITALQTKLTELEVEVQNAEQDKTTSIAEVSDQKSRVYKHKRPKPTQIIPKPDVSYSGCEKNNRLTGRLANVLQDNAVQEGDITRLEDDLKEQIAQLVEKIHENDALLEELEKLRVGNEKLRAQTMKLQKDHRASVDALMKVKVAYFEAKKTIEAVQNDAKMKEAEAERNSEEREARARTEIRNLTEMLQKLEHELEAARVGASFSYWAMCTGPGRLGAQDDVRVREPSCVLVCTVDWAAQGDVHGQVNSARKMMCVRESHRTCWDALSTEAASNDVRGPSQFGAQDDAHARAFVRAGMHHRLKAAQSDVHGPNQFGAQDDGCATEVDSVLMSSIIISLSECCWAPSRIIFAAATAFCRNFKFTSQASPSSSVGFWADTLPLRRLFIAGRSVDAVALLNLEAHDTHTHAPLVTGVPSLHPYRYPQHVWKA
ncbi:hypothetical protein B0H11DRAFT_2248452, partial [Mycena galericulata]